MIERCIICGAKLINSTDGIGCGCRAMLKKCTYLHMKNNEDKTFYYKYWNVEATLYLKYFKSFVENVNFRSNFKKSFASSVIAFYDEKGYVSRKQLDVIKSIMQCDWRIELIDKQEVIDKIKIVDDYKELYYKEIVEMTHKMWKKEK